MKVKGQTIVKGRPYKMKLEVKFPLMDRPRTMKSSKLNRLVKHLQKMSTDEFEFVFESHDFMEITPN